MDEKLQKQNKIHEEFEQLFKKLDRTLRILITLERISNVYVLFAILPLSAYFLKMVNIPDIIALSSRVTLTLQLSVTLLGLIGIFSIFYFNLDKERIERLVLLKKNAKEIEKPSSELPEYNNFEMPTHKKVQIALIKKRIDEETTLDKIARRQKKHLRQTVYGLSVSILFASSILLLTQYIFVPDPSHYSAITVICLYIFLVLIYSVYHFCTFLVAFITGISDQSAYGQSLLKGSSEILAETNVIVSQVKQKIEGESGKKEENI